mmetsp:Transcript_17634/g.55166  ORF Transcript_17634/g.55166 Transcript_17634/m.55166 type:complete len:970 (-) Transcript_17634:192-3101(-)
MRLLCHLLLLVGCALVTSCCLSQVTTIKKRFAHEPETYKAFLEILHTYQKEQRSIKDVLEQVSQLFADHADLLKEFTYFLPDAVQEQAKERLSRAARESEMRRERIAEAPSANNANIGLLREDCPSAIRGKPVPQERTRRVANHITGKGHLSGSRAIPQRMPPQPGRSAMSSSHVNETVVVPDSTTSSHGNVSMDQGHLHGTAGFCAATASFLTGQQGAWERQLFQRLKDAIAAGSRDQWPEFLKCLDMFAQDLIEHSEMLDLASHILGKHSNTFAELKRLLSMHGTSASADGTVALSGEALNLRTTEEADLTFGQQRTPSYRELARGVGCLPYKESDNACINDRLISQPVGSEEAYSFAHVRKNHYEEALFRYEDERFEMDMIIDSNSSAIVVFEGLEATLSSIAVHLGLSGGKLAFENRRLSVVHCNAVKRVYGERSSDVIEMLRKNPVCAVPVILRRLRQKDKEWRRARAELYKQWKEDLERYHNRSLDHRSFYFRQREKKSLITHNLLSEILALHEARARQERAPFADPSARLERPQFPLRRRDYKEPELSLSIPHADPLLCNQNQDLKDADMLLMIKEPQLASVLFGLIDSVIERGSLPREERSQLRAVWQRMNQNFFTSREHSARCGQASEETSPLNSREATVGNRSGRCLPSRLCSTPAELRCDVLSSSNRSEVTRQPGDLKRSQSSGVGVSGQYLCQSLVTTRSVYILLRLYHQLMTRLELAHRLSSNLQDCEDTMLSCHELPDAASLEGDALRARHILQAEPQQTAERTFEVFVSLLNGYLDGSVDTSHFEDTCRQLLGTKAYPLMTIDRLVVQMIKQLHLICNDDLCVDMLTSQQNYHLERRMSHQLYREEAATLRDGLVNMSKSSVGDGTTLVASSEPSVILSATGESIEGKPARPIATHPISLSQNLGDAGCELYLFQYFAQDTHDVITLRYLKRKECRKIETRARPETTMKEPQAS